MVYSVKKGFGKVFNPQRYLSVAIYNIDFKKMAESVKSKQNFFDLIILAVKQILESIVTDELKQISRFAEKYGISADIFCSLKNYHTFEVAYVKHKYYNR